MRSFLFALASVTLLAITFVALPAFTEESADLSREQQIYAALIDADFDADNIGPETRSAIRAWQRDKGYEETGTLTIEQLRSIRTKASQTVILVTLEPKCADIPGSYLGENHAECWAEAENQRGCFVWRTHYHSDQRTTRWTGPCRNGVAEGRGTYWIAPGSDHSAFEGVGTMVGGKPNGHWVVSTGGYQGEGEYRDGLENGHWVETFSNGVRYEGDYRNGMRDGQGTQISPAPDIDEPQGSYLKQYVGEWRDDVPNGLGVAIYWDGMEYEGQWSDGKYDGYGIQTWPSGKQYDGHYREGKPHGFGTALDNGKQFKGEWRNGCFREQDGDWAIVNTSKAECGL